MSVFNALVTGVSGLSAQSQALATISDNIANVNTAGYKRVSTRFTTLVTQSNQQIHSPGGVRSNPFHSVDVQGLLQSTGGQSDIGIEGKGFFVVNGNRTPGVGDEYVYSRAGSFNPDNLGYLKNAAGYFLQGWPLTSSGALPSNTSSITSLQTINLSNITGTARATTAASVGANLPATSASGTTQSTQVTIYDTLGVSRNIQLTWTKTATANQWELSFSPSGGAIVGVYDNTVLGGSAGAPQNLSTLDGSGVSPANRIMVTFDSSGGLANMTYGGASILGLEGSNHESKVKLQFNFSAAGASATQNIDLNFGLASGVTTAPALTAQLSQVGNNYSTNFVTQDGVAPGSYIGISIATDGTLNALFDNGETRPVYRIALADFPSPTGLEARSGNAYSQSSRSGNYVLKQPASGGAGRISGNTLEASTVDIAKEFSDMILTQRAYSANTKVISTANDMLQELIRTVGQ